MHALFRILGRVNLEKAEGKAMDTVFDNDRFTQSSLTIPAGASAFSRTISDSLGIGDTDDYTRLELAQRSSLLLTLSPTTGNADLALLDSSGNPVDGLLYASNNPGSIADAIATDTLNPGTYFIRVSAPTAPPSTNNYTLTINTGATGRSDLLWRKYGAGSSDAGTNALWLMNGATLSGISPLPPISDLNWKFQATGDFNGDGFSDYILRNFVSGDTVAWLMDSSNNLQGITPIANTPADPNWRISGAGDFDGDGKTDLFWSNETAGLNAIWYMDGTNLRSLALAPSVSGDPTWKVAGVGDFNQDGKPDLVWRNQSSGSNTIWLMDNTTILNNQGFAAIPDTNWQINGVGDFNGDGKSDLAIRNYSSGQNIVWLMDGTAFQEIVFIGEVKDTNWVLSGVVSAPSVAIDLAGNTTATAFNVGTLTTTGRYSDRIGSVSDPADYYTINIATSGKLNLSLRGLTADASLELLAADGVTAAAPISNNAGTTDEEIKTDQPLAPGTYYVKVASGSTTSTAYTLGLRLEISRDVDLLPTPNLGGSNPPSFRLTTTTNTALPATGFSLNTASPQVQVHYNVRNNSLTTSATFKAAFYLSADSVITPGANGDLLLTGLPGGNDFVTVTSLAAGTSTGAQTVNVTLPAKGNSFWSGDKVYYIGMAVDSGAEVIEVSETNNTVSTAIRVIDTGDPDVVGGALAVTSGAATPGNTIGLTGTIKNIGTAPTTKGSPSNQLGVRFRLSNDQTINNSDLIFTSYLIIPTIAAGGSVNFNSANVGSASNPAAYFETPFTLPSLAELGEWGGYQGPGTYYIGVEVNEDQDISFVLELGPDRFNNKNYDFDGDGNALNDNIAITITA
jgi:FG-GAP-like repeat/Bacterial pre-peptidase C-terminal domain/CARDB/FG-GAP repeat